uniref:Uncharacterized protein n=1 Tax=viral metagenome TaxID=1070528 RepID=A0A6M3IPI8_9ZZZZ
MNNEAIIYLLRKTSLTRTEIGKLKPEQLNAVIKEVLYQEAVEEYQRQYSVASIMAAIYNTIPRKSRKVFQAKDFLKGDIPTREPKRPNINVEVLAKQKGIILPSK